MPRVSIDGTNKTFEINRNEILYDALYDQGEKLPHGCLSGSCGACRIEIIEGGDNLVPATIVEENTVEAIRSEFKDTLHHKTLRLSCRARVIGDVVFRPIK